MNDLDEIVVNMLNEIRRDFKSPSFNVWFGDFKLTYLDEKKAVFTTPSKLRQKFLSNKYLPLIAEALFNNIGFEVEIEILSTEDEEFNRVSEDEIPKYTEEQKKEANEREENINAFLSNDSETKSVLNEYTFDNFIEGESNKFAKAACRAVAKTPFSIYNPLFIYGESGLGKTHLLYAITNEIKRSTPEVKILYKKGEDFVVNDKRTIGGEERTTYTLLHTAPDVSGAET